MMLTRRVGYPTKICDKAAFVKWTRDYKEESAQRVKRQHAMCYAGTFTGVMYPAEYTNGMSRPKISLQNGNKKLSTTHTHKTISVKIQKRS